MVRRSSSGRYSAPRRARNARSAAMSVFTAEIRSGRVAANALIRAPRAAASAAGGPADGAADHDAEVLRSRGARPQRVGAAHRRRIGRQQLVQLGPQLFIQARHPPRGGDRRQHRQAEHDRNERARPASRRRARVGHATRSMTAIAADRRPERKPAHRLAGQQRRSVAEPGAVERAGVEHHAGDPGARRDRQRQAVPTPAERVHHRRALAIPAEHREGVERVADDAAPDVRHRQPVDADVPRKNRGELAAKRGRRDAAPPRRAAGPASDSEARPRRRPAGRRP